jgi:outer membrane protein assembly factor BamB
MRATISSPPSTSGRAGALASAREEERRDDALIIERDGVPQVIVSASRRVRCYELATGKQLWECGGLTRNVIATPVADASTVYAMSAFGGNALLAIRLGRSGDLTDSDAIAWRRDKSASYVPSPVVCSDRLYCFAGVTARLSCFDTRAGTPLIDAENVEALSQPGVYASPIVASGRVYLVGRNGKAVVLKRSDQIEVLATNTLDDEFEASPAAVETNCSSGPPNSLLPRTRS